jgi:DNA-binding transcriptional LysR family regulator
MKITLEALAAIDAIERRGSYAGAAEELHKVPSAVTYMVQKLESDLDIAIFDRSGHRSKLTEAGKVLLEKGRQLLRDARDLECRATKVSTGWESQLRIGLDAMVPFAAIVPYATAFLGMHTGTSLQFSHEALGGTWDALYAGRADLIVGAVGEAPYAGFACEPIGTAEFVLCVAPGHPLAQAREPMPFESMIQYRGVAIADSSRQLAGRTACTFEGQETIEVANVQAKLKVILAGLGIAHLPVDVARPYLDRGELIAKKTCAEPYVQAFHLAWRPDDAGQGVKWWVEQLRQQDLLHAMWRKFSL